MASTTWRRALGGPNPKEGRSDRVLPVTRWVAAFIIPWLAAAFVVLYGVPDQTTRYFAWTIRPEMTPIIMGAGYGAGVYFFYRVYRADAWHAVAPVFLGITAFTWLMAAATALHWGNFNHGHYTFALWVFLYALTPLLVPAIWLLNGRTGAEGVADGVVEVPRLVRVAGGTLGVAVTLGGIAYFVRPGLMIEVWPWGVSPLTARILAGWFTLFGVVNVAVALDSRWSGARVLVQSQIIGFGLVLVGALRVWDDFDTENVLTWVVVGGMAIYLLAIVVLYLVMESR